MWRKVKLNDGFGNQTGGFRMEQIFITNLIIQKVRHLNNISIPLGENQIKHLILTGKNGSGKTNVVEALADYLNNAFTDEYFDEREIWLNNSRTQRELGLQNAKDKGEILQLEKRVSENERQFNQSRKGLNVTFNQKTSNLWTLKEKHHYVLAYYPADRIFEAIKPLHVEKVQLKEDYQISEFPRSEFVKYLLDLKVTEALARNNKNVEKADSIQLWFEKLEQLLKQIFDDSSIELLFDEETFDFHISQDGKELFDFNTLSSGYQAVLDIVLDMIMRMESQTHRSFNFNLSGIVLIDEIETHLHLELQKNIMPLLTTIFPNIQFIVTSHSPFILNSLENVVIYDLENHLLVENGLDNIPYDGIVEGYFRADKLSNSLKTKFDRYKSLIKKESLSDDEINEVPELEWYLDEIPDYLSISISTEYQRLNSR